MLRKTTWKIAAAVLAVVIAGIVYCVFFAEEKSGTVQYQTDEEITEDERASDDGAEGNSAQAGIGAGADSENGNQTLTGSSGQNQAKGQNSATSLSNGTGQQQILTGGTEQSGGLPLIYVHVCGAVKKPAVYALPEGSRVCDAIAEAGGLTEHAADDYVNQARFLTDGERVYIPEKDELGNLTAAQYAAGQQVTNTGGSQSSNTQSSQEQFPVNINTATLSELMTLPGIGESRAESIIAYREKYGAFATIEDIMQISGIKDAAYEKIKNRICTGNE